MKDIFPQNERLIQGSEILPAPLLFLLAALLFFDTVSSNTEDLYFVKSRLISARAEISGFVDCVVTLALDR